MLSFCSCFIFLFMNDFLNNKDTWNEVAKALESNSGLAVVTLPPTDVPATAFAIAREALDNVQSTASASTSTSTASTSAEIPATADSAHVTGYHKANNPWSPRYNRYREGFIFSDGNHLPELADGVVPLEDLLHRLAQAVLGGIERNWELPQGWFEETMGPTRSNSQWHLKRYVEPEGEEEEQPSKEPPVSSKESPEPVYLLPTHTDPSLISIVLHHENCRKGLEYSCKLPNGKKEWRTVEASSSTDAPVAVIMVGSVLATMTAGYVAACKHRVVMQEEGLLAGTRMAATLFVRPAGTALLHVPPALCLQDRQPLLKRQVTFDAWNSRVARNYQKSKKKAATEKHANAATSSACRVVYQDEWTELSLISSNPPLSGQEKFLGGELATNGKIYTIPGHSTRVMCIDPNDETIEPLGPSFVGQYKWLRSVRLPSGVIAGIPCHADSILRIDPETSRVSTLTWENVPLAPEPGTKWKWHGGQLSPIDGCFYAVPQRAERVLKIDPATEEISFLEGDELPGHNKWYGGLLGSDGAVYGIPQCHTSILRIDPATQRTTLHGDFPEGGFKWHGGIVAANGVIIGIPAHADTILKIVPGKEPQISTFGGPLRTGAHRSDGKYKYLGAANGGDGKVYLFPSDTDYVLQIDPENDTCREVGPNLREIEHIHHNKWQNGFTSKCKTAIYGIPLKGSSVLRILTKGKDKDPDVAVIGGPFSGLNHWEGGVMSDSGDMFCMPLNYPDVLRIRHLKK